jgi:hypothetical protein
VEAVPAAAEPIAALRQRSDERGIAGVRTVYERGCASCLVRSRRRWLPWAAGSNRDKALMRLEDPKRHGEVLRVGRRWSTQAPPSDVAAAMDRLAARTSNVRIVRKRARVG